MDPAGIRKNIRLPSREYVGTKLYFLTLCCEGRKKIFADAGSAETVVAAVRELAGKMKFLVHAYCLMPDHLHLLGEGREAGSDTNLFVKKFKQKTAYLLRDRVNGSVWQRYYYDHVLRGLKDSDAVAWYIWMNPVRKGLVSLPWEYEFSGSETVEWPPRNCQPSKQWNPPWRKPLHNH